MSLYQHDKNENFTNKKVDSSVETTYEYNDANLITKMANKKGCRPIMNTLVAISRTVQR